MITLLPADYAVLALALILAITGLFRGFSGSLAFVAATTSALALVFFGWPFSATLCDSLGLRVLGLLIAVLLAFGLVRAVVARLVHGILAQPADAIFGFLLGLVVGVVLLAVWAKTGEFVELSNLAQEMARLL